MTTPNDTRPLLALNPQTPTIQARLYSIEELCIQAVIVYRDADLKRDAEVPLDPLAVELLEALLQVRERAREARHAYNHAHGL